MAGARGCCCCAVIEEQPEHACYRFYAPTRKTTRGTLAKAAGQRWQIEQAFQLAKGECGLDHYEVFHWQRWYRHITLAMRARAVLATYKPQQANVSGAFCSSSTP